MTLVEAAEGGQHVAPGGRGEQKHPQPADEFDAALGDALEALEGGRQWQALAQNCI